MKRYPWAICLAASHSSAAFAQMPAPATICPAQPAALPPELQGWSKAETLAVASGASGLAAAKLTIGSRADVTLLRTPQVDYPLRPEKPGGSVSYGGLLSVEVTRGGTYRVALGSGAWIDLIRDGAAVTSTAHGRGPDCSGIRKMVDFALTPGKYVLQIAGNGGDKLSVLVTQLP